MNQHPKFALPRADIASSASTKMPGEQSGLWSLHEIHQAEGALTRIRQKASQEVPWLWITGCQQPLLPQNRRNKARGMARGHRGKIAGEESWWWMPRQNVEQIH